jgi:hypothetical protein
MLHPRPPGSVMGVPRGPSPSREWGIGRIDDQSERLFHYSAPVSCPDRATTESRRADRSTSYGPEGVSIVESQGGQHVPTVHLRGADPPSLLIIDQLNFGPSCVLFGGVEPCQHCRGPPLSALALSSRTRDNGGPRNSHGTTGPGQRQPRRPEVLAHHGARGATSDGQQYWGSADEQCPRWWDDDTAAVSASGDHRGGHVGDMHGDSVAPGRDHRPHDL